jgi:adenylate cyclase
VQNPPFGTRSGTSPRPWVPAPYPQDEAARVKILRELGLLDTPPDERMDALVKLAAYLFRVPISYVALVDSDRQWFKARVGLAACETGRDEAFCSFTILQDQPFIIPDARSDERFATNPLVVGEPHIGAYIGIPLKVHQHNVGTLCLADHEPRDFTPADADALKILASIAERELTLGQMVQTQDEQLRLQEQLLATQREKELLFDQLQAEKQRAESFLLSLMPADIAEELSSSGCVAPRYFHDVTVLFTDFVGFSNQTEVLAADDLVHLLNRYFSAFDAVMERFGLEKLKTIGDSYMCVGGLPETNASHPVDAVLAAMELRNIVREFSLTPETTGIRFEVRIGIHTGPVVAGVVGTRRFAFDIWGETVNLASRMESSGAADCINISERTFGRVKDFFDCEHRGRIMTKDLKERDMYFVRGPKDALTSSPDEAEAPSNFARRYRTYFRRDLLAFPRMNL